ncbi:hypothetical protein BO79DRAFT_254584 [Aspergillus costaricaensis CBS 115574]|uniref:Uncharacterized protein n=1 Tax=Aspergillus costaricaensis CBS 115574 TaxID=1448317 RepID=A0ACD1IGN5_9EURO|nr:hypothetical protein BO79DRAFT_254584 [Aspergillus costaricaensis CBS 115574]RAK89187.1 hypothetical protein BO79DRAFT_254584 [Aspergillus costaricaensis CBS 115574]
MPSDYRSTILYDILTDIKAAHTRSLLLGAEFTTSCPGMVTLVQIAPPSDYEDFWLAFCIRHGFGTRVKDIFVELSAITLGARRASRLIQLALNIGSPEVYISIKACLDDIRKLHHSTGVLNTDSACEENGMSQPPTSEAFAAIQRRVRDWKAYSMAKHNRVSGNHTRSPSSRASVRNLRNNKGNYWDHLVQHVRGGNPNILCLITQRVTIMPPSEGTALTATSYRDLMVGDCILVGKIFKVFRPTLVASADARLIWTLSSLRGHSYQYGLERLNEGIIIQQQLSSSILLRALQRVH